MNTDTLKKFTEEAKEVFLKSLETKETQNIISATKDDGQDNGTFKVIMSSGNVDRQGEIVKADGWDTTNFMKNPVVLWAHDYSALPIGIITRTYVEGNNLCGEGKFASGEANPFAQQVRKLYDMGIVRAVSVGFIPTAYDRATSTSLKQELLELSFVPVPANADAIRLSYDFTKTLGLDTVMLSMKGITIKTDEVTETVETTTTTETVVEEPKKEEVTTEIVDNSETATTTETTTTTEQPAEKGAVADELAESEMNEAKYANLDEFFEIIWAFVDVYMDPAVSVDQFATLVAELITLLQTPANLNDDATQMSIAKMFVANKKSGKLKAGRSISAKNAELIKSAIAELEKGMTCHANVSASLTEFLKGNGSDGDAETTEEKTVVTETAVPVVKETLDVLHDSRKILVIAKDVIEEGISRYNSRIVSVNKEKRANNKS